MSFALFTALSLHAPTHVLASGPTISNISPADGAVVTGPFRISALVEDPNNIATATVSVAGVAYRTTLTYHIDWVCCSGCYDGAMPVTNYARADIFADIPDLPPGTYTVTVRAQDSLGNVSTRQWSVVRTAPITFSDLRPAPSSISSSVSEVSARISGANLDPASVVMMIDGAIVPHTWIPDAQPGSGVAVHTGILPPGTKTARLSATDIHGSPPASHSWSFVVDNTSPVVTSMSPPEGSTSTADHLSISATLSDPSGIDAASLRLFLNDNRLLPVTITHGATGATISWNGIVASGAMSARVEGADRAGNTVTRSWPFTFQLRSTISNISPAEGAVVTGPFRVSASVHDLPQIAAATVSVAGVDYPTTLTYHVDWVWGYDYDTPVTDLTRADIFADIPDLPPGIYTVIVRAQDSLGNVSTRQWSVVRSAHITFSDLRPLPSSRTTHGAEVSARISGPNLDPASIVMMIDGAIVPHTWIPDAVPGSGVAVSTRALPLPPGTRTVNVSAGDALDSLPAPRTWSFSVETPWRFRWISPASGSATTQTSIPVSGNVELLQAVNPDLVRIEYREANVGRPAGPWVLLPAQYNASTRWISGVFNALQTETRYEIRFTATGPGCPASAVINIFIDSAEPKMQAGNFDCNACHWAFHTPNPGQQSNCSTCHGWGCSGSGCHSDHEPVFLANCLSCHTTAVTLAPNLQKGGPIVTRAHIHTPLRESERHATTSSSQCGLCHDRAITTEHRGLTTRAGQPFTCLTCHAGPSGSVPAFAILPEGSSGVSGQSLSGDSGEVSAQQVSAMSVTEPFACETCHVGAGHDALHDGGLAPFPASCGACHVSNLIPEHNGDCALCHAPNVDITISTAVANNDVRCNTCHPGLHVRTWGAPDYYAPDTRAGPGGRGDYLRWVGDNPTSPGVHGGYKATTAKCGVCHSVHRARGDGIFLLNTQDATCTGCHRAGASTVTNVVITWEAGGPHGSGDNAACTSIGCHLNNPHGVGGSQYQVISQKLLNPATDALLTTALASPNLSGITTTALSGTVWPDSTESLVRTGYNCNLCHTSTMLAVVGSWTVDGETRWWAENRHQNIGDHTPVSKTGHPTVGSTTATSRAGLPIAWAPVTDCESCHDQTDSSTRTGYTFPHSQTPRGTSVTGTSRAWLWMSWAGSAGATRQPVASEEQKAFDGNCLKCHRSAEATAGVGITY